MNKEHLQSTVLISETVLEWFQLDFGKLKSEFLEKGLQTKIVKLGVDFGRVNNMEISPQVVELGYLDVFCNYYFSVKNQSLPPFNLGSLEAQSIKSSMLANLEDWGRFLESTSPSFVLIAQGYQPLDFVMRIGAIQRGVSILSLENTFLGDRLIWDDESGITVNRNLAKNIYFKYEGLMGSAPFFQEHSNNYLREIRSLKTTEHSPGQAQFTLDDRPMILFLGQVLTDSSVIFGLRGWRSPVEIIRLLANYCIEHHFHLIVKLHPKEHSGADPIFSSRYDAATYRLIYADNSLMQKIIDNDFYIDYNNILDTFSLIRSARLCVTVNSQAGLESALMGKPTIVCGDAFYDGLDFTIPAPRAEPLYPAIGVALNFSVPPSIHEFFYILTNLYFIKKQESSLVDLCVKRHLF